MFYQIIHIAFWIWKAFLTSPYRPGGGETICPADGSSTVAYRFAANQAIMDPKISADLRPSADGSAVHTSLVAGSG